MPWKGRIDTIVLKNIEEQNRPHFRHALPLPPFRGTVREDRTEDHESDPGQRPGDKTDKNIAEQYIHETGRPVSEHHQDTARHIARVDIADAERLQEQSREEFQYHRESR